MKSRNLFACLVVMLSFSTVALGTIQFTPHWTGVGDVSGDYGSSQATATASGGQDYEYSHAKGSMKLITTEAGEFDWWYYCEANAFVYIFYNEANSAWAWGKGEATADICDVVEDGRYTVEAEAYIDDGYCGDPPDLQYSSHNPDSITDNGSDEFEAYEGIYASHEVTAEAEITVGSDNVTMGLGGAGAVVDLDESE